jgi:hypothetical protein
MVLPAAAQVDQYLPSTLEMWLVCMVTVVSTLALICVVFPWFLIGFFPIMFLYWLLQQYFRRTSRGARSILYRPICFFDVVRVG